MKVTLGPGCDLDWLHSLSSWQHSQLAQLFRQGRGLRDGTNHNGDFRWRQAGVTTRNSLYRGNTTRQGRHDRTHHERILIVRTDYGFAILGLRRTIGYAIDPDTGEVTTMPETWVIAWREYVSERSTANFPPSRAEAARPTT